MCGRAPERLGLNPGSATHEECDFGHTSLPLCLRFLICERQAVQQVLQGGCKE